MAKKAKKKAKKAGKKKASKKAPPAAAKKASSAKPKAKAKKKARRTVMYSKGGKKLYAKRDAGGKFKDIQSYAKAHAADMRQDSNAEQAAEAAPADAAPSM